MKKERKKKVLILMVSESQREAIIRNAIEYAEGSISEWIRYAATYYIPRKAIRRDVNKAFVADGRCSHK